MPRGTGKRTSAAGAAASDTLPLCDETTCALCKLTHELRSRRDRWLRINVESYHYDVPRTSSAMLRVLIVTLETGGSRRDCLAISRDGVPCMLFREIKTRMTSHGRIKKEDQRRSQFNKMYSFCSSQPPLPAHSSTLLLRLGLLVGNEWLAVARADAHIGKDLLRSQLDRGDVGRLIGDLLLEFLPSLSAAVLVIHAASRARTRDAPGCQRHTCSASTRRGGTARADGSGRPGTPSACGTRRGSGC